MSQYLIEELKKKENVHIEFHLRNASASAAPTASNLFRFRTKTVNRRRFPSHMLFIFVGSEPATRSGYRSAMIRDAQGFNLHRGRDVVDLLTGGRQPGRATPIYSKPAFPESLRRATFATAR